MRKTNLQKLQDVMQGAGIDPDKQRTVMLGMSKIRRMRGAVSKEDADWGAILTSLAQERRSVATNMHNRKPELRPMYVEYLSIMDKVKERIEIARTHGAPADAAKAAVDANHLRELEGARPGPTNGPKWQSWVPPHIRTAFTNKVVQTYASIGRATGNKFIPFVPLAVRKDVERMRTLLTTTITRIRDSHEAAPGTNAAYTPYRALYLCAARMAEREMARRLKAYELGTTNPVDNPLPVNWLALLDAPMRARLRAAQVNPAAVDSEGLQDFLTEASQHVVEDMQAFDIEHAAAHPVEPEQENADGAAQD